MEEPGTRLSTDSAPPPHPPLVSPAILPRSRSLPALFTLGSPQVTAPLYTIWENLATCPYQAVHRAIDALGGGPRGCATANHKPFPLSLPCQKQRLKMTRPNPIDLSCGAISTVGSCDRHHGTLGFS